MQLTRSGNEFLDRLTLWAMLFDDRANTKRQD